MVANAIPCTLIAGLSYLATIMLGTFSLRGRRVRRVWHTRLFAFTVILTLLAAALSFPTHWQRGVLLLAALVPLALLPWASRPVLKHPERHIAIGLSAAPFYLSATVLWVLGAT
ncbi:hypothetical protein G7066_12390 [Leucobacter coleopterorum]|uniref:Uncharacterized protein n=1 Tax=Leucobacter coleopterorum TaxID=2714933 RepID=A0ABX6JXW2_9MICO|nr:hypothetical protein [Leucobacter coleopterorum]QIM19167.1 hypothetical protein G7066_12390 [Leucobacter coleopterorum]